MTKSTPMIIFFALNFDLSIFKNLTASFFSKFPRVDPGKKIIIFSDELILKGSLLFFEKSYPFGIIASFGNFLLKPFLPFFYLSKNPLLMMLYSALVFFLQFYFSQRYLLMFSRDFSAAEILLLKFSISKTA